MALTGRPPKPLKLKLLNGSAAQHPERVPKAPAQPLDAEPEMPEDMGAEAKVVWRRIMRTQAPGVILAAHADLLRVYCEAQVRYVHAQRMLDETGALVKSSRGLSKSPLHQIMRDNSELMMRAGGQLGLSPSSVSVLSAANRTVADPMADLLTPRVAR